MKRAWPMLSAQITPPGANVVNVTSLSSGKQSSLHSFSGKREGLTDHLCVINTRNHKIKTGVLPSFPSSLLLPSISPAVLSHFNSSLCLLPPPPGESYIHVGIQGGGFWEQSGSPAALQTEVGDWCCEIREK